MSYTVDGFHDGERRSTYSAANFVSAGPEAGRGTGVPPPFSRARKASLVGLHRVRLAEGDAARLAVAAEAKHPGPRAVRLDSQHEALQGGIVFALAAPGRERERISQAGAFGHRPASQPSSMSARARDTLFAASNTEPSARCA